MPNNGAMPWHNVTDPDQREALAALVIGEMQSLADHPGWKRLMVEVGRRITKELDALVAYDKEDERRRGKIAALRIIESMPEKVAVAADTELTKYRGN